MNRCDACQVQVEGDWQQCPLCGTALPGPPARSTHPTVPLAFSRRRVLRALFLTSLAIIALSFAAQLFFVRSFAEIGALRAVWLGVASLWLVVLMAVRKRRNVAKGTLYLVVIVGLMCAYWDYLSGWHGWSLDYAIPIVSASAILALIISVSLMRTEVGDHILYSGVTVLLGLAPIVFLALGWVSQPIPSAICSGLSLVALVLLLIGRRAEMRHELAKRLHL